MATTYKTFSANDIVSTRTLLHEAIPLTGTIVSGTYKSGSTPTNVKNYSHGMFQSVYDYPYLSSSANHIFDLSVGISANSGLSSSMGANSQHAKKQNTYNQMAQVLMGFDENGAIRLFDEDGDLASVGTKLKEVIFVNFSRLLTKDEIKKGTFKIELDVETAFTTSLNPMATHRIKVYDKDAENNYFVNSPAGDYGILYADTTTSNGDTLTNDDPSLTTQAKAGLLFYQAGIAVLSGSVFDGASNDAEVSIMADTGTVSDGQTLEITNHDGTVLTLTIAALGGSPGSSNTSATQIDRNAITHADQFAVEIHKALGLAKAAGTLKTAAVPSITPNNGGQPRVVVLTSNATNKSDGNSPVGGTLVSTNKILINQKTAGGAQGVLGFTGGGTGGILINTLGAPQMKSGTGGNSFRAMLTGSEISSSANAIRHRIYNIEFNNTTELNSTVYFCRAHHNEFNYSNNPTYVGTGNNASKIQVKNQASDSPISYITGIGLYSSDNELLASAKVSEPLRKDPTNELTLRVRLDY